MATDNTCRLCFAREDMDNDIILSEIEQYLPFLDSFAGVSHDECMPQKICSTCQCQIESSQLLRKRVQMTEYLWSKSPSRNPIPEASLEVLLMCHLCNYCFDFESLILHIGNVHGVDHFDACELCRNYSKLSPEIMEVKIEDPLCDVEATANDCTESDSSSNESVDSPFEAETKRKNPDRHGLSPGKRHREDPEAEHSTEDSQSMSNDMGGTALQLKGQEKPKPKKRRFAPKTCPECSETLPRIRHLNVHLLEVHGIDKRLPCKFCEEKFTDHALRTSHLNNKHPLEMGGQICEICGATVLKFNLQDHMDKHKGLKKYHCDFEGCGRQFSSKYLVQVHRPLHSDERPFACEFPECGMTFKRLRTLRVHEKTHSKEKTKQFKCSFDGCTRSFNSRFDMRLHERRHTGEKPYSCNGCGESFYTNSLLKKHEQGCAGKCPTDE